MAYVKFEIQQHLLDIGTRKNGWQKEVNKVSWYDKEPVYDIRAWSEDHTKMGKGITLTEAEFNGLKIKIQEAK